MAIAQAAQRAVLALGGGHTADFPDQDSAEVAAVYAVCDTQAETGTRMWQYTTDGTKLKVGKVGITGQQDLLTIITFDNPTNKVGGTWDGLQRR